MPEAATARVVSRTRKEEILQVLAAYLFGRAIRKWGEPAVVITLGSLVVLLFLGLGAYFGDIRVVLIMAATTAVIVLTVTREHFGISREIVWVALVGVGLAIATLLPRP